jgi:CHAT domain-containing protein/tetratricopeptide (TPR) repeat protein
MQCEVCCMPRSRLFPRRFSASAPLILVAVMLLPFHLAAHAIQTPGAQTGAPLTPDAQAHLSELQTALKSAIAARDAHAAGKIFNQIGEFWLRVDNPQNALEAYNHALAAAKLAQDAEQGVAALNGLGNVARAKGQPQEAMQAYQRALEVATAQGVTGGKADALNGLALTYASAKQPDKALEAATQALAIRRSMGDRAGEGMVLAEIATGYNAAGDKQKALQYAQQALDAYQAAGAKMGEATVLIGIGDIYASLRDKQAMDYYSKALAITQQSNFPRVQASALNKIGSVQNAQGKNKEALDNYKQALAIEQRFNMADASGNTLSNIALAWSDLGEKQKALDYDNQAVTLLRTAGDRDDQAVVLNNMGMIYQQLGDKQKALDSYNQALSILQTLGDRANAAMTLDNMGATYVELGENQKAIDVLNQAISLQTGLPNPRREAIARVSIGMAYHKLGDDQKALESLNRGLDLVRQVDDRPNEARAYTALAKVYGDMGNKPKALESLNQALPLARAVNDPLIEAPILYGMMLVNKAQPTLAIYYGKQAVNLLQQVRNNIQGLDKALQSGFVSSKAAFYHDLADLLIAQGRLPEAQQVLDLLKQQEYVDYVRGGGTDTLSPLTLTAAEQKAEQDYEKSTAQLVAAGEKWSELKNMSARTPQQDSELNQLSDQLKASSKALNDYYARLYVLFGKDGTANKQIADVKGDVSALKEQIAQSPHTVALYTMLTSDHYRVIVITPTATVAREFAISDADLNKKVADFEQVLRDPSQDPRRLAQELNNILLGPVQADLDQAKAETLVWSLDGVLRYVPMAALYDGKQYAVEKYNTVTITPASIPHLEDKPDVSNLSVAAMGIARKYEDGLPALPAVTEELDNVVKDAQVKGANGALPGTILLDGQFTEKAMEDQLSGSHKVVHIASHFVFKPGDDSQSYLLLAGDGGAGFHLTVADFRDNESLTLQHTDLLTLSACETGMSGSASNGREVDGLGTTAQLKGAKAVISSLWPVNDASTGQLMGDFYRRWAAGAGKVTKVEALRKAQLDLLLGQVKPGAGASDRGFVTAKATVSAPLGYAHPFYWAPFVLMGNWR